MQKTSSYRKNLVVKLQNTVTEAAEPENYYYQYKMMSKRGSVIALEKLKLICKRAQSFSQNKQSALTSLEKSEQTKQVFSICVL